MAASRLILQRLFARLFSFQTQIIKKTVSCQLIQLKNYPQNKLKKNIENSFKSQQNEFKFTKTKNDDDDGIDRKNKTHWATTTCEFFQQKIKSEERRRNVINYRNTTTTMNLWMRDKFINSPWKQNKKIFQHIFNFQTRELTQITTNKNIFCRILKSVLCRFGSICFPSSLIAYQKLCNIFSSSCWKRHGDDLINEL